MSGKTTVARVLGDRHGRAVIATQALGTAVRAVTGFDPAGSADYREYSVTRSVESSWPEALAGHRRLAEGIGAVAHAHATWARPAIVERWAVSPETVVPGPAADITTMWPIGSVHSCVVVRRQCDRGPGFGAAWVGSAVTSPAS
jgi:hypothetical protein